MSERAVPPRSTANRLIGTSGAGGAEARLEGPSRGAAKRRSEPTGAVRPLPGDGSARGVDQIVDGLLQHDLKLREFVARVLLEGSEVGLSHGPPALAVVDRHYPF